jgi:hypothetical protein
MLPISFSLSLDRPKLLMHVLKNHLLSGLVSRRLPPGIGYWSWERSKFQTVHVSVRDVLAVKLQVSIVCKSGYSIEKHS